MKKIIAIIMILFLLCSCTRQSVTDIYEFARRLNAELPEKLIEENDYRCSENEYYYFLSEALMLTLTTNDNSTVTECELTAVHNSSQDIDKEWIFDVFTSMCSVLTDSDKEDVSEYLNANGLSPSVIGFYDFTLSFGNDKEVYFIYSNSEIISLLCEIYQ